MDIIEGRRTVKLWAGGIGFDVSWQLDTRHRTGPLCETFDTVALQVQRELDKAIDRLIERVQPGGAA